MGYAVQVHDGGPVHPDEHLRVIQGDLPFDPGMLEYPRKAEDIIEKTMSPSSHKGLRKPPTRGLRDWRSEMTPEEVARFQDPDASSGEPG